MRLSGILILVIGHVHFLFAQEALMELAIAHEKSGDYSSAYAMYREASEAFFRKDEFDKYITCHLKMIHCQLQGGKPFQAKTLAENTLDFIRNELKDKSDYEAEVKTLSGLSLLSLGRNDEALKILLEADQGFKNDSEERSNCLDALGIVYTDNENRELATQYLEQSLQIRRNLFGIKSEQVANSFNNLGRVYLTNDPLQAIVYLTKALNIYLELLGCESRRVLRTKINIAYANMEQENYDEALKILEEVKLTYENLYGKNNSNVAFTKSIIGRTELLQKNYDKALVDQNEALQQYISLFGEKHPDVANTYFLIGEIHKAKGEINTAIKFYQKSIYANLPDQSTSDLYDLPELKNYFNADILLYSLQAKAMALEALHYEKTLNVRDLAGALETYTKCDELITLIRRKRLNEVDKLRLGQVSKEIYERGIQLSLNLSSQSLNKKKYLQQAFEFCERSKSAVLLEAITDSKAKEYAGIPQELLNKEDSLKDEISYLEQKIVASDPGESHKDLLFAYQNEYRKFIVELETNYPEYYNLKYRQSMASIEDVQNHLSEHSTMLSYFLGAEEVYVFNISRNKAFAQRIRLSIDFEKHVKALRNSIKYNIKNSFFTVSSTLYDQLIPKKRPSTKELIILPDGSMGTIPFEALISSGHGSTDYSQAKFLIQDYQVSYDYSATLFIQKASDKIYTNPDILLMAPVDFQNNGVSMHSLPETETEINRIDSLFKKNNYLSSLRTGSEASEANLKKERLDRYQFLHLATHGFVNESEPALSRIFLNPEGDQDGSVYTSEIYNLNINADLVTLSACETGLGKISKGEGIVGLSRALQYAGANNIIVSLWQVADASTSQMMSHFYDYYLSDEEKGYNAALRKAKLKLLNAQEYSRPYFWAPFILIGR